MSNYDTESLYGNFRTNKFTDIYEDVDSFLSDYNDCGIPTTISATSATTLFYLLYAKFGNSHIASSDENQFKYKLFSTIFMYGPAWEKRLDIQNNLRNMSMDELLVGSVQIHNYSENPSIAPTTATLDELTTINNQAVTKNKRNKLDAYAMLNTLLETDVTAGFLDKFKKLFLVIVNPELPLWYITEDNDEDEEV